jgi:hypothetical protein
MTPGEIFDRLMQGTARRPLEPAGPLAQGLPPGDPATPLRLLALASQAHLFALPPAPSDYDEVATPDDPRPVVPAPARALMLRLVSGKGNPPDDSAAFALAVALERLRLRPHPFDVPRMEAFVRKHAERLGPAAAEAFARAQRPGDHGYWLDAAELDRTNWALATPARKASFIAGLRASDPDGARELVEQQLPLEKAEIRLRLVDALATSLASADRAFLESLLADRAPTVKQAATRLLARLPGTGAAQAQIEELLSRVTAGGAGLLRKRTVLKLQLPANLRPGSAQTQWLAANFGAVGSGQLAAALGLDEDQLADAAQDDKPLLLGIAFAACTGRNFALLARIAATGWPGLWAEFLEPGLETFGLVSTAERESWAAAVLPAAAADGAGGAWQFARLQGAFDGPLPATVAAKLFQAALGASGRSDELLTAATALLPLEAVSAARRELGRLPPDAAPRASLLAELLDTLSEGHHPS